MFRNVGLSCEKFAFCLVSSKIHRNHTVDALVECDIKNFVGLQMPNACVCVFPLWDLDSRLGKRNTEENEIAKHLGSYFANQLILSSNNLLNIPRHKQPVRNELSTVQCNSRIDTTSRIGPIVQMKHNQTEKYIDGRTDKRENTQWHREGYIGVKESLVKLLNRILLR